MSHPQKRWPALAIDWPYAEVTHGHCVDFVAADAAYGADVASFVACR
jgi:hypothetical protein